MKISTVSSISKKKKYIKKAKIKKVNKLRGFCISIFFLFIVFLIANNKYTTYKCKDLDYAIKKYTTTGIFNENKLYSVESYEIRFSDGNFTIVEVKGLEDKAPYKPVTYTLHLQKNTKGTWKLKEYYPRSSYFLLVELHSLHIPLFKLTQLSTKVNPVFILIYSCTCCIGQSISTCL